ncbi:alpha/beta fold hydrolase [Pseudomonas kairouanensis]|uniref:Alpha/beta fold hydrolase n=1 Tax=Pseudomonas kairouanensis TaxID=2293832 RepID=A0A4Z0ALB8_9PSED|nr:alpha/beta fold hydrolase [Pseudomonas kairouanensis]TFY86788.1 alpha/beta fold hydrolase [Pseudomonas kairouanensis]
MKPRPTAHARAFQWLVLLATLVPATGHTETPPSPFGIEWFLDCTQPALARLDPEVVERTQCGIVTAPLDHAAPERGSISFDITRVGARQPLSRQGALFANPGGPGLDAGGTFAVHLASVWKHYAQQPDLGETYQVLADTYDVVEVTPRGLGSVPGSRLECRSDAMIVPQGDASEDRSEGNLAAVRDNARLIAQACASHPLAPYITTEQTARDLEFVRKQLGELQFNYLGNAYGTWLGAWYGGLFPAHVGRMVLDSNINWTSTFEHASFIVAGEKEKIFDRFVAQPAALDPGVYQLGDSPVAVRRVFMELLPSVRTALRSSNRYYSDPASLMGAHLLSRWLRETPDSDDLTLEARARAHQFSPDPLIEERAKLMFSLLLQRVREPLQASVPKPGPLRMSAADSVRTAILCNDSAYSSEAMWQQKEAELLATHPVAGSAQEARQCTTWPRKNASPLPHKALAELDSLLMVQAEFDDQAPSTGAAWAFERTFPASRVQLKDTYAHGVSFSGVSACVSQWVGDYLVHGTKPPRSTVCNDAQPVQ